jgi:predicted outer membrane repeat protein
MFIIQMSTYTVTNPNDIGSGTLRDTIVTANANPGSTINFSITGTITITSGVMPITAGMNIVGPGANFLNIQRTSGTGGIFSFAATSVLNISDLTISNGNSATNGGAIRTFVGNSTTNITNCNFNNNISIGGGAVAVNAPNSVLNVTNCSFTQNAATTNGGGAILGGNTLSVTISNSTFENNSCTNTGGGAVKINSNGTSAITDCVFQGNSITNNSGGAINLSAFGTSTINRCTINGNTASVLGGGIYSTVTLLLYNTTISNNSAGTSSVGGGLYVQSVNSASRIVNCTLNGNFGSSGGALAMVNTPGLSLIGTTISNNSISGIAGGGISLSSSTLTIGNTVVAINPIANSQDFLVSGSTIISLGGNFIGNADGTGVAFTQLNDHAGTSLAPINPLLFPLGNYGGPTLTMLPRSVPLSPLINAGNNTIVVSEYTVPELQAAGQPIDQRGLLRIVAGTVDIGSVETGQILCVSGKSKILTKNILTDKKKEICAENVLSNMHLVFDVDSQSFIPILYNIVNGPVARFYKIAKDSIDTNIPSEDFYITSGHKLIINGIIMKARDVPQSVRVKTKSQKTYSICTKNETAILINGMSVMTWSHDKFLGHAKKNNIHWVDNHI